MLYQRELLGKKGAEGTAGMENEKIPTLIKEICSFKPEWSER